MIQNDFLDHFAALRAYADNAVFRDHHNDADGVVYPHICTEIPRKVRDEVMDRMADAIGRFNSATLFMRLSPAGVHVPHPIHSDESMGRWSLMLYLNRREHCRGGTALVRHKATGMASCHDAEEQYDTWQRDMARPEAWETTEQADMRPNRAFIFDATRMHMALPAGGFGSNQRDGRLVLTGFFS